MGGRNDEREDRGDAEGNGHPRSSRRRRLEHRALPAERVVRHDLRLDILCCLVGGEPLTATQLSGRIGKALTEVVYHVIMLDSYGLIEARAGAYGGAPSYAATLDGHPAWVRRAVEEHRGR